MKVEKDDLVVVNDLDDTIVYIVESVKGFMVSLQYQSGYKLVSGGELDISMLRKPSRKQLENNGLS